MDMARQSLGGLENVVKTYGKIRALDGLTLELRAGEVLAVLGANGAGKSTAIAQLLGLSLPDSGRAELFGESPQALVARRQVGVMLQSAGIPPTNTVRELIHLTCSYYADPLEVDEAARMAGVDALLNRRYAALSGGQQRRVQFALAICGRPKLVFLDEPTTGLDIDARQSLWRAIRQLVDNGTSVLLTTHYLEEAEALANRIVVVDHGKVLAEGTPREIASRVARSRIRCLSALNVETVAAWPGVESAVREGARLQIVCETPEAILRRLLDADDALSGLEVSATGLAEAFLALTQNDTEETA